LQVECNQVLCGASFKRDSTGSVTHEKRFFGKPIFLVTEVFSVFKLILWYLYTYISSIDLATRFKIEMYLSNRERFSEINRQVLNEKPTSKKTYGTTR